MAKDSSLSKEERRAARKAAKSESTSTLVEPAGISKEKSSKKEKKSKDKKKAEIAEKMLNELEKADGAVVEVKGDGKREVLVNGNVGKDGEVVSEDEDETMQIDEKGAVRPIGALVPFANPLADEKVGKKVFKGVKKAAAQRTLKRGVKEVVKALRKSVSEASASLPVGIVVLAADISPMDVISHIPVLCEDHNIPYIYVTSRAELGMAGQTKRPTSVVMVGRDVPVNKKKGAEEKGSGKEDKEEWSETYKGLVKIIEKEGRHVKV
ncbi:snoRNA-binding protein [Lithohypha guttulata]|nr:snoRNA-binding protein [Lithohypha guttulata]